MTPLFALEQQVAIAAVRRACTLTTTVFNKLVAGETTIKDDKSPVTVADYSAQAVINTILSCAFPFDPIVGEEDSADLRDNTTLRARVWGLGKRWPADSLLEAIDRGGYPGGRTGRMWTLDPIDGTKGFLRGGQYAVCLALLVDAHVELGVIGCPNLPVTVATPATGSSNSSLPPLPSPPPQSSSSSSSSSAAAAAAAALPATTTTPHKPEQEQETGALFVAVRGQGAYQLPLSLPDFPPLPNPQMTTMQLQERWQQRRSRLYMPPNITLPGLSFLESVEKGHAALDTNERVAARLGVRAPPVRMDSQAKYAALVRGDAGGGVYLRLPVPDANYQEKIWDHAPGSLLVQEAGGIISDLKGRPLDFGLGRTLGENFGVVAARKEIHAQVIEAIQDVLSRDQTIRNKLLAVANKDFCKGSISRCPTDHITQSAPRKIEEI
ncbi:hypothetical protein BGW80DRAFT_1435017 [Lactifluus volemus]|nr:hypothetical protein BGW80DRAFT_1435017 [Lactifluus volemus]